MKNDEIVFSSVVKYKIDKSSIWCSFSYSIKNFMNDVISQNRQKLGIFSKKKPARIVHFLLFLPVLNLMCAKKKKLKLYKNLKMGNETESINQQNSRSQINGKYLFVCRFYLEL